MDSFELIIFDTYDVALRRSPRYLEEPLVEEIDATTRDLVDEERYWARLSRRYRLTPADVEAALDHLAAKFCRNLDIWKQLPAWGEDRRLALVHGGPAGLLRRWRADLDLGGCFESAIASTVLGVSRADPALYTRLAADAGLAPSRCLLVDDERGPIAAAHAAGMGAYRFGTAYGLRAVLADQSLAFEPLT